MKNIFEGFEKKTVEETAKELHIADTEEDISEILEKCKFKPGDKIKTIFDDTIVTNFIGVVARPGLICLIKDKKGALHNVNQDYIELYDDTSGKLNDIDIESLSKPVEVGSRVKTLDSYHLVPFIGVVLDINDNQAIVKKDSGNTHKLSKDRLEVLENKKKIPKKKKKNKINFNDDDKKMLLDMIEN